MSLPPTASAQSTDTTTSQGLSRRIVRKTAPIAPVEPIEAGSFLLYPEILVSGMYDDNVYYAATDKVGDWAAIASPSLFVQSAWDRHALNFYANTEATRYHSRESENTDDHRVSVEGRYDITARTNVFGGYRWAQEHEDRESPDSRNGFSPTRYTNDRAYAGALHNFGSVSLRVGGTAQRLDYKDVRFTNGLINMDDRDRDQYTGGFRLTWEALPTFEPFLQVAADVRRYQDRADDLGYQRDSEGVRTLLGARFLKPGRVKAELFGGHLVQRFEDTRFPDIRAPAFGANVIIQATPDTSLSLFADRTAEETTISGVSGNLNSFVSASLFSRISGDFAAHANTSFSRNDYQVMQRTDDYFSAGLGVYYYAARGVTLEASYQFRNLHSSVEAESFQKHQLFLRLILTMPPARKS
jgi:hypothetical protein